MSSAEALAKKFHEAYERLAPSFGYKTREASAKPWEEVPENNRKLMEAVAAEVTEGILLDDQLFRAQQQVARLAGVELKALKNATLSDTDRDKVFAMSRALGDAAPVLQAIGEERARQEAKWGEQNHPDGTCAKGQEAASTAADFARHQCDQAAKDGVLTWKHILDEEVMESYAEADPEKLKKELIQSAAVIVAWIGSIERRQRGQQKG